MRITASNDGGAATVRISLLTLPDITVAKTWQRV